MDLKLINRNSQFHPGYGAGNGTVDRYIYECPCGKDEVIYEKDNIPGFRDSAVWSNCDDCNSKYEFGRGTAILKE